MLVIKELAFTAFHAFGSASGDVFAFLLAYQTFHPQLLKDSFSEGYFHFRLIAHGCHLIPWGS